MKYNHVFLIKFIHSSSRFEKFSGFVLQDKNQTIMYVCTLLFRNVGEHITEGIKLYFFRIESTIVPNPNHRPYSHNCFFQVISYCFSLAAELTDGNRSAISHNVRRISITESASEHRREISASELAAK